MTRRETDDHYIYQYLDLVDETNGRAWVTADRPVKARYSTATMTLSLSISPGWTGSMTKKRRT